MYVTRYESNEKKIYLCAILRSGRARVMPAPGIADGCIRTGFDAYPTNKRMKEGKLRFALFFCVMWLGFGQRFREHIN